MAWTSLTSKFTCNPNLSYTGGAWDDHRVNDSSDQRVHFAPDSRSDSRQWSDSRRFDTHDSRQDSHNTHHQDSHNDTRDLSTSASHNDSRRWSDIGNDSSRVLTCDSHADSRAFGYHHSKSNVGNDSRDFGLHNSGVIVAGDAGLEPLLNHQSEKLKLVVEKERLAGLLQLEQKKQDDHRELEMRKFEFEKEKWKAEMDMRQQEMALRQQEVAMRQPEAPQMPARECLKKVTGTSAAIQPPQELSPVPCTRRAINGCPMCPGCHGPLRLECCGGRGGLQYKCSCEYVLSPQFLKNVVAQDYGQIEWPRLC